jgi:hypothetical protein
MLVVISRVDTSDNSQIKPIGNNERRDPVKATPHQVFTDRNLNRMNAGTPKMRVNPKV